MGDPWLLLALTYCVEHDEYIFNSDCRLRDLLYGAQERASAADVDI